MGEAALVVEVGVVGEVEVEVVVGEGEVEVVVAEVVVEVEFNLSLQLS